MRLADDRRGRLPFALVGVLLLVGSSTFAATLSTRGPVGTDRAVETSMDRATAAANTALRTAVTHAARDAARNPVTAPANTSVGGVLNESTPFRDSLRIRIYVAARERFRAAQSDHRGVVAGASLPPTPNASALRAAKRRVSLRGAENGTVADVTVRNVTFTARRGDRVVARETTTMRLQQPTPALALHDRTAEYERRLNRRPLEGGGLGRRLSARLYPLVWARAYAQYGGLPVDNVLSNRHVELSANGAVLASQRRAFGRSDPEARRGFHRALVRVGAKDLLAATGLPTGWAEYVLAEGSERVRNRTLPRRVRPDDSPSPEHTLTVAVEHTADRALARTLGERRPAAVDDHRTLDAILAREYRADARVETAVETVSSGGKPPARSPGRNWTLVDERTDRTVAVRSGSGSGSIREPAVGPNARVFERHVRRVTVERTVTRVWKRGSRRTTTTARWEDRYRVGVALVGAARTRGSAPARPVEPLFERGGTLDGPNLDGVPDAAGALLEDRGGPDAVARAAVDADGGATRTVEGERPERLERWVVADLVDLNDRVRNLSVRVESGRVAGGAANPQARLAVALRDRRAALVDAPTRYDGVADRARVAARAAYLDRVIASLDRRANDTDDTNAGFEAALADAGAGSSDRVLRTMRAARDIETPRRRDVGGATLGGSDTFVPDGSPGYLTLSSVGAERVAGVDRGRYHPLVAENHNLFTLPYGDAADGVAAALIADPDTVRLRTAAKTLVAANRTLAVRPNATLRTRRDRLRYGVADSLGEIRSATMESLADETVLTQRAKRRAVDAAFTRWNRTGHRALASTNGSLAAAVAEETAARSQLTPGERAVFEDRLRVELRVALLAAARTDAARVPQVTTNETVNATRTVARAVVAERVAAAGEGAVLRARDRLVERDKIPRAFGALTAGLPVAPVPGYWYATVNAWRVTVRGEYPRFSVRTRRGTPGGSGSLTYVRDGSAVELDVDGDGDRERLGRNERIAFETGTTVAVAVPPGRAGVGDTDGVMFERSVGWNATGCARAPGDACLRSP